MTDSMTITLMGFILILGLVVPLMYVYIKKPEGRISDMIASSFITGHGLFYLMVTIGINVAESLWAASVGEFHHIHPLARFVGHTMIGFVSVVAGLHAPIQIANTLEFKKPTLTSKDDKQQLHAWKMFQRLSKLWAAFLVVLVLFFPILNAWIIASGLGQADKLWGYFATGLSFDVLNSMHFGLKVTIAMLVAHFTLIINDAFMVVTRRYYSLAGGEGELYDLNKRINNRGKNDASNSGEKKKGGKGTPSDAQVLDFLLKRYGGLDDSDRSTKKKMALDVMDKMDPALSKVLSQKLWAKKKEIEDWDGSAAKKSMSDAAKKAKNQAFRADIGNLWKGPVSTGEGLGITLPQSKKRKK